MPRPKRYFGVQKPVREYIAKSVLPVLSVSAVTTLARIVQVGYLKFNTAWSTAKKDVVSIHLFAVECSGHAATESLLSLLSVCLK
jgi:hypothetical protein